MDEQKKAYHALEQGYKPAASEKASDETSKLFSLGLTGRTFVKEVLAKAPAPEVSDTVWQKILESLE